MDLKKYDHVETFSAMQIACLMGGRDPDDMSIDLMMKIRTYFELIMESFISTLFYLKDINNGLVDFDEDSPSKLLASISIENAYRKTFVACQTPEVDSNPFESVARNRAAKSNNVDSCVDSEFHMAFLDWLPDRDRALEEFHNEFEDKYYDEKFRKLLFRRKQIRKWIDFNKYTSRYTFANVKDAIQSDNELKELNSLTSVESKHRNIDSSGKNVVSTPFDTFRSTNDHVKPVVNNWKMKIQMEATSQCLVFRKHGASPTTSSLCEVMAKWCRDNDVKTDSKIFPSAGYLRTHVLGGKHWNLPN